MQRKTPAEKLVLMAGEPLLYSTPEVQRLFEATETGKLYPAGFRLFSEGQSPAGLFLVKSGRVRLSITRGPHPSTQPQWAEPGHILGLNAALNGVPYEATAETATPSQVAFVERNVFLSFLQDCPQAAFRLVEILSQEVYKTYEQARSV